MESKAKQYSNKARENASKLIKEGKSKLNDEIKMRMDKIVKKLDKGECEWNETFDTVIINLQETYQGWIISKSFFYDKFTNHREMFEKEFNDMGFTFVEILTPSHRCTGIKLKVL